jgi:hypothetical protein
MYLFYLVASHPPRTYQYAQLFRSFIASVVRINIRCSFTRELENVLCQMGGGGGTFDSS